ncbi:MAG TPA: hypothetical protein ENJ95_07115 [Bacteroidetes bacterium]|nr:hypothetical protein [Bacteroidota bacterium]
MKLKIIPLSFLLIIFTVECYCQLKFSTFDLNAGLTYGKPASKSNNGIFANSSIDENFSAKIGLSINGNVYAKIAPRLDIGTGINFTKIIYTHNVENLIFGSDIINGTVSSVKNKITIDNIGVPLLVKYDFSASKKLLQGITGITLYRTFWNSKEHEATGSAANEPGLLMADALSNKFNLSAQFGLRLLLRITENNHFTIGASVEYYLLSDGYYFQSGTSNIFNTGLSMGYNHVIK